jgi:hypothetical protein
MEAQNQKKYIYKKQIALKHQNFLQEKSEKCKLKVEIKFKEAKEQGFNDFE